MKTIYLAWQNPKDRLWFPIGRLTRTDGDFEFVYTKGAIDAKAKGFELLQSFPDLEAVYKSSSLFPLFANRLLPASRPDYPAYVEWLNVSAASADELAMLGRSGGRLATDTYAMFPCPEPTPRGYETHFFAHGLRYFSESTLERINNLKVGERLLLVHDFQNPHDIYALMLRTNDSFAGDRHLVGYCPRYLLPDAITLINQCDNNAEVTVEQVNPPPAPLQMRLLCKLVACWPGPSFEPYSTPEYQPIAREAVGACR